MKSEPVCVKTKKVPITKKYCDILDRNVLYKKFLHPRVILIYYRIMFVAQTKNL